ncbi:GPCR kinase [Tanacetum coccineum]
MLILTVRRGLVPITCVMPFGGTVSGKCLETSTTFLKREKLEQVVSTFSLGSPYALGDLNVTLKDLSWSSTGTINYKFEAMADLGKEVIISGPAGLVQRAKLLKENVFILDPDGVSAINYVNAFGGTVTGCLGDIDNFLKKGKLEQVVAIVKSCSSNALGDLNVTLKDLSGTVPGTINYKVLDVGSYGKDITVGAAMILANVSVFTHKPSKHYLNITKRNVVEVFRKDTVLGSGSG